MMFSSEQRPGSSLAQLCRYKRTLFPGLLPWHPLLAQHPHVKLIHGEKKDVREPSSEANASSCVGPEAVLYCCSTVCSWLAEAQHQPCVRVTPSKPCPDLLRKDSFSFPLVHWVRGSLSVFTFINWTYS